MLLSVVVCFLLIVVSFVDVIVVCVCYFALLSSAVEIYPCFVVLKKNGKRVAAPEAAATQTMAKPIR